MLAKCVCVLFTIKNICLNLCRCKHTICKYNYFLIFNLTRFTCYIHTIICNTPNFSLYPPLLYCCTKSTACGVFYPNSQYDNHMFLNFLADAWFNPDRLHPKGKRRRIGVCVCVCV